jgi:hypothetical protein
MAVKIKHLMMMPELQDFILAAGSGGIENVVQKVSYFDHKDDLVSTGGAVPRCDLPGDLYLSNLSTCYQDEEDMMNFFEHLILVKSSGLIVDNHYVKEFPAAVIDLCNTANFPVLIQPHGKMFYSPIIYAIMQRILLDKEEELVEMKISHLLSLQAPSAEIVEQARHILLYLEKYYVALYSDSISDTAFVRGKNNWFCIPYRGAVLLILSEPDEKKLSASHDYAVRQIRASAHCLGVSEFYWRMDYVSDAMREAIAAFQMCNKLAKNVVYYRDLRVYSLLLPHKDSVYVRKFRDTMLEKIIVYDKKYNTDYYGTICVFVANHGDFLSTAQEMHIHKNSVRYRINKIIETFFQGQNLMDFYADISVAIKIDQLL